MITTKSFNINSIDTESQPINKLIEAAADARQESILAQLNDLVAKGLLTVKLGDTAFYRDHLSSALVYKEQVTLELKVQEYIVKLEKENAELKEYVAEIKRLLNMDMGT